MLWNFRSRRKFELYRTGSEAKLVVSYGSLANTVHRIDHAPTLISTAGALHRCAQRHAERDVGLDGAACFLFS